MKINGVALDRENLLMNWWMNQSLPFKKFVVWVIGRIWWDSMVMILTNERINVFVFPQRSTANQMHNRSFCDGSLFAWSMYVFVAWIDHDLDLWHLLLECNCICFCCSFVTSVMCDNYFDSYVNGRYFRGVRTFNWALDGVLSQVSNLRYVNSGIWISAYLRQWTLWYRLQNRRLRHHYLHHRSNSVYVFL